MSIKFNERVLSVNEASQVTGVPLKQAHRIIDAGLLGDAVRREKGSRVILGKALVGLKFAHETTAILTLKGRMGFVRYLVEDPEVKTVREDSVSIDVRPMQSDVKRRLAALEKTKKMVTINKDVLGSTPCFRGTRVAVHDLAEMVVNGDDVSAILAAYPILTEELVHAAVVYADAYPRRGRPRQKPLWRKKDLLSSNEVAL